MSTTAEPSRVRFRSRRAAREFDALSQTDYRKIRAAIAQLASDPRPSGSVQIFGNIFRIRVGRHRIIYLVDDGERTVDIGGVRRRSESTYRGVRDLF